MKARMSQKTQDLRKQMHGHIRSALILFVMADEEGDPVAKSQFIAEAKAHVTEAHSAQVWVCAAYEWIREATQKPMPGCRRRGDTHPPKENGWWDEIEGAIVRKEA